MTVATFESSATLRPAGISCKARRKAATGKPRSTRQHSTPRASKDRVPTVTSSPEEMQLTESLAIARAKLAAAEKAWKDRIEWQRAHAAVLFERSEFQRFQDDLKLWRAEPRGMQLVFGSTWHSAAFLTDLWNSILASVDSHVGLTYDQVKHAILALGGDWRVDRLDAVRGHFMCCFLALHPDPATFSRHWIADSRARRPGRAAADIELDRMRAKAFLDAAPTPTQAKASLKGLAQRELSKWSAQAERLSKSHAEARDRCVETNPPHFLGDAAEVRETRRIQRELTAAQTRFDRLERMLNALRKSKAKSPQPHRSPQSFIATQPAKSQPIPAQPQPDQAPMTSVCPTPQNAPQPIAIQKDTPTLRNEIEALEASIETLADKLSPKRRPDPKSVAQAWRAKQGKVQNGSTTRSVRSSTEAALPGGTDVDRSGRIC